MSRIRRALLSVSDVAGLEELAVALHELGIEIVASSGTGKRIAEAGVPWLAVEEVTGAPEMLGGRVKTLHPGIHGGILARRDVPEDLARIEEFGIKEIGLVVVNLYPFRETVATPGITDAEVIEKIDVGGPAMVRAAAKNHQSVGVVTSPSRYAEVIAELREHDGVLSDETRRRLAAEAFTMTAGYDAAISAWFMGNVALPDEIVIDRAAGRSRSRPVARVALRRKSAPRGRVLRRSHCLSSPAHWRRPARRQGALVQQPCRSRSRARDCERV
jgi:AICAR transformylase/IMP cyclohydrolase PurH